MLDTNSLKIRMKSFSTQVIHEAQVIHEVMNITNAAPIKLLKYGLQKIIS